MSPDMPGSRHTAAPLAFAIVVLGVVLGVCLRGAWLACEGHFVYAIDDPYIHLAMARTLVEHGVWGVTPDAYAFSSSSPGWTLLLASLYRLGMRAVWVPLALNVSGCVALLVVVDRAARRVLDTDRARLWLLLAVAFAAPLPTLVLFGMETVWHLVLVAALAAEVARANVRGPAGPGSPHPAVVGVLALAAASLRYETGFLVAAAAALLAWRRQWRLAGALCAGALVPVVAYAAYAVAHGGWWLPTAVVLKGDVSELTSLGGLATFVANKGLVTLFTDPPLAALLVVVALLVAVLTRRSDRLEGEREGWLLLAGGTILLHVHLLNFEWFFRYRAYLVTLALVACAAGLSEAWRAFGLTKADIHWPRIRFAAALVAAATLAGPVALRAVEGVSVAVRGSRAVYLQQFQMARFLAEEDPGQPVGVNDIGAVAFYTRRPILDLVGLATQEVAAERLARAFTTADLDRLTRRRGVGTVVIYRHWFRDEHAPPSSWVPVAEWTASESVTVANDTVTWFATNAARATALRARLAAFAPSLPAGVRCHLLPVPVP